MANIFHARFVILTMSVYHLSLHESKAKVLGMRSPEMKNKFTLCCQIINSLERVGMDGTRGFGLPWNVKVWWQKE